MFDKYIIGEGTVRNVKDGDAVVGFAFDSRIPYYRGLGVSMVEPFEVKVDGGDVIPADQLRFSIGERTWTWEDLEQDFDTRWELLDTAVVTVMIPGGLAPGGHVIEVTACLRVSYLPFPARTIFVRKAEIVA